LTTIAVPVPRSLARFLFTPGARRDLESLGTVRWADWEEGDPREAALSLLEGAEVAIGSWGTIRPDEGVMGRCGDLRLWVHAAGSVRNFFGPHLEGHDLTICNCVHAIAGCVAQMTVGELVVGCKRVLDNAAANRAPCERHAPKPANSRNLSSTTCGVVGASTVGRAVIRLLRSFGARILCFDPYLDDAEAAELGVESREDLVAMCRECDALTIHTPLLPSTRGLIGVEVLRALADDAVLVNCSRGGCVDEAALVAELEKGRLFAFLDVTDPEPAATDSPLRRLDNVVLTSHIAGGKDFAIGDQAVADVRRFLAGDRPLNVVTADMLDRIA